MKWGSSTFKLLGITFSVDLDRMINLNYRPVLDNIDNTLKKWSKQYLTPFGKITILKTLVIAKLNHLFLSIPIASPDENMLRNLTNKMYGLILDNKSDKAK